MSCSCNFPKAVGASRSVVNPCNPVVGVCRRRDHTSSHLQRHSKANATGCKPGICFSLSFLCLYYHVSTSVLFLYLNILGFRNFYLSALYLYRFPLHQILWQTNHTRPAFCFRDLLLWDHEAFREGATSAGGVLGSGRRG